MSKKTMLEKHIKNMQARVAKLRETQENSKSVGLARLIESEIDKTESMINAKAVTGKLQGLMKDLVGIQGKDLFDMMEKMKEAYGPEFAEGFKQASSGALTTLMSQVEAAKDAIDNQILRMEKIINGEPADDMNMDMAGADADMGADGDAPDMGADGDAPDMGGDDMAPPQDGEMAPPEGDEAAPPEGGAMPDLNMGNQSPAAAGRDRKESFLSDKAVLEAFRRTVREGVKPSKAAKLVAEQFAIDTDDVKDIVKDAAKA